MPGQSSSQPQPAPVKTHQFRHNMEFGHCFGHTRKIVIYGLQVLKPHAVNMENFCNTCPLRNPLLKSRGKPHGYAPSDRRSCKNTGFVDDEVSLTKNLFRGPSTYDFQIVGVLVGLRLLIASWLSLHHSSLMLLVPSLFLFSLTTTYPYVTHEHTHR